MKSTIPLLAAGGILAFVLIRQAKRTGRNLNITPAQAAFTGINVSNIKGWIVLEVMNPENTAVKIQSIFVKLNVSGKTIGQIVNNEKPSIRARETTALKLEFSLPLFSVISAIPDLISELKKKSINVGIEGFVDTALGRIPIADSLNFKIPI